MKYAIKFTFPEGIVIYAGMYKDTMGSAPTLATAVLYNEREVAERWLANGYGPSMNQYGEIIEVPA